MNSTSAAPPVESASAPLAGYQPSPESFDEAVLADGSVRAQWQPLLDRLFANGPEGVNRLRDNGQRLIYENGVTFLSTDETGRHDRPWQLDAIPLLLPPDDWATLSAGLAQRAKLLNAVLCDLYGPQNLIREKLLPPETVFANPRFLRPLQNLRVPENRYLHHYAADIARAADGRWWVLGDLTSSPSGAGYALENRIATSRMMPEIFRDMRVERLAPYFIGLRNVLQSCAPQARENPHVVLLSRGSDSAEYFEDAYLSRYLGYTLVESGDLAVRENRVMLKTLGGLVPIDVILRRPDDEECDPVELNGESLFGVAGLLEVVRAGQVAVANALGSSLAESPMLAPFLPALSRHLLGEELLLPSVATWWCGDAKACEYVLTNLDRLVVRSAFHPNRDRAVRPANLSEKAKQELIDTIRRQPAAWIGQESVKRSTAPVWDDDKAIPWHVALRTFLVTDDNGYSALPGGLVRMSTSSRLLDSSMSAGDRSQDVWVLADGPVGQQSLLNLREEVIRPRRSGAELPSRVAENLFWFGRYIERVDGSVRLLRSIFSRLISEIDHGEMSEMPMLLRCLASSGQIEPGFALEGISEQLPVLDTALPDAIFDDEEDQSLSTSVHLLRQTASRVRDRISLDLWRIVTRIDQTLANGRRFRSPGDVLEMLNHLVIDLAAFGGLIRDSMTRSLAWRFLDIGRRIERTLHTSGLIRSAIVDQESPTVAVLETAMEVGDCLMTYRSRYLAKFHSVPVIDLLLLDETNPRSIAFQLFALSEDVASLPRDPADPVKTSHERIAMSLLHSIRMVDGEQLVHPQEGRQQLDRLLARIVDQLPNLAQAISHRYLIHAGAPRQFVSTTPGAS